MWPLYKKKKKDAERERKGREADEHASTLPASHCLCSVFSFTSKHPLPLAFLPTNHECFSDFPRAILTFGSAEIGWLLNRESFVFLASQPTFVIVTSSFQLPEEAWMRSPNHLLTGHILSISVLPTWEWLDMASLHSLIHGHSSSRPSRSLMQCPLLLSLLNHFLSLYLLSS